MDATDPYEVHESSLRYIHSQLLGKLGELGETKEDEVLAAKTVFACRALLWHHRAEGAILFPHLRRAGRLRSADLAFLDRCDREHEALHGLSQRLLAKGEAPHLDAKEIAALASELGARFAQHAYDEETALAAPRLRTMIGLDVLAALAREAETQRPRSWGPA